MVPGDRSTKMNVTALVHKELPTYWRKKKKVFFKRQDVIYVIHVGKIQRAYRKY